MENMTSASDITAPQKRLGSRYTRALVVCILAAIIAASAIVTMIGPPIMLTAPLALVAGGFFAFKRSFWSLVCFGYPLVFGFLSAWIGYYEMGYGFSSIPFLVAFGIGLAGMGLISTGLWKSLPGAHTR